MWSILPQPNTQVVSDLASQIACSGDPQGPARAGRARGGSGSLRFGICSVVDGRNNALCLIPGTLLWPGCNIVDCKRYCNLRAKSRYCIDLGD